MEQEIWKDIYGYEGLYQVSSLGRVKSLNFNHTKNERIMKPGISAMYQQITLCTKGIKYSSKLHILIANAFIVNPKNKRTVNHKNGIKTDNRVDNLEWATDSENMIHAYENGLR